MEKKTLEMNQKDGKVYKKEKMIVIGKTNKRNIYR